MRKFTGKNPVDRILDANINRAKEGLRVCEEITRFILENVSATRRIKKVRHSIDSIVRKLPRHIQFLNARDSANDIGQKIYGNELSRADTHDIFSANIQRVKESLRVLEEFSKLKDIRRAVNFKKLRYKVYEIEKEVLKSFSRMRNTR